MEQHETANRQAVTLTHSDWNSIIAILQAQARQQHQRGNDETAAEIRMIADRVASQL